MSHVRRAALHLVCTALVLGIAFTAVVRRIAHPQVLNFSIAGSVADVSGTAVPSAQVKVTKHKTNETREVAANDAGGYVLSTVVGVDAMLQVGTVTVTAKCIQSQTDRADVHGDFNSQQLDELAQPTRTYQGILALIPGIAPPSASSGGTNVRIDGVTDINPWVQDWPTYVPCNDSIQSTGWAAINRTRFSSTIRTFDGNSDNGVYYE